MEITYKVTVTLPDNAQETTGTRLADEIRGNLWHILNEVRPDLVVEFTKIDEKDVFIDVETEEA